MLTSVASFDNASAGARHIVAIGVYLVWLLMPLLINADVRHFT